MKLSDEELSRKSELEQFFAKKRKENFELEDRSLKEFIECNKDLLTDVRCGVSIKPGWFKLVGDLCESLRPLVKEGFKVEQVKEKFGGLRFYVNKYPKEISSLISEAESKSFEICEDCGAPGKRRNSNWIRVLCDECSAPHEELQHLNDKSIAWGCDDEGWIWVDPNKERIFVEYKKDFERVETTRLPTSEETRSRYNHGYSVES